MISKSGTSHGATVTELDGQATFSEFVSHWVSHTSGLALNQAKPIKWSVD